MVSVLCCDVDGELGNEEDKENGGEEEEEEEEEENVFGSL